MKKPSHQEIEMRAYHLWERAGKPEGQSLRFWLISEMECEHDWHKLPHRQSENHVFLK